jgi:uncharacterized protein
MMNIRWGGVDFGSKLAGTTAITFILDDKIKIVQTTKGQDADKWLVKIIKENNLDYIFMDSPLSLPAAFFGKGDDFNYRKADRLISAMSPMFLGGLTARAIKLKTELAHYGVSCIEVYPGGFVRNQADYQLFYNKKDLTSLSKMTDELLQTIQHDISEKPTTYHQLDSLICWYIGDKYLKGQAQSLGDAEEGLIWI